VTSEFRECVAAGGVPMMLAGQAGFASQGLEVVEAGLWALVPGDRDGPVEGNDGGRVRANSSS